MRGCCSAVVVALVKDSLPGKMLVKLNFHGEASDAHHDTADTLEISVQRSGMNALVSSFAASGRPLVRTLTSRHVPNWRLIFVRVPSCTHHVLVSKRRAPRSI